MTPWGKRIAFYLWTKSIAAGVLLLSALLLNMGFEQDAVVLNFFSPALSLIFLAATMLLLVFDLKRPGRFFYLLTKPNLRSWLVLGGYVLMIFGILASVWLVQGIIMGVISPWVVWSTALFAIASACYSAFLFAQARGRDFWQSPLLFWQLLIQAMTAGAAVLMLLGMLIGISSPMFYWLGNVLVISLLAGLAMIFAEHIMNRRSEEVARAGDLLIKGALWKPFWIFVVLLGSYWTDCADSLADSVAHTECDCACPGFARFVDVRKSLDQSRTSCAAILSEAEQLPPNELLPKGNQTCLKLGSLCIHRRRDSKLPRVCSAIRRWKSGTIGSNTIPPTGPEKWRSIIRSSQRFALTARLPAVSSGSSIRKPCASVDSKAIRNIQAAVEETALKGRRH